MKVCLLSNNDLASSDELASNMGLPGESPTENKDVADKLTYKEALVGHKRYIEILLVCIVSYHCPLTEATEAC